MAQQWLNDILDRASSQLLRLEEARGNLWTMRVHPDVYNTMAHLRRRELAWGLPLIVLGTEVIADASVAQDEFVLLS